MASMSSLNEPDEPPHTGQLPEARPTQPTRSLRKASLLTASLGLAHALLFLLAFWLVSDAPGASESDAEIARFYASDDSRRLTLVGLYLMPFAGIAFIWFIVCVRMWIATYLRREDALLSNVQLVSGILYVALLFAAAAASSAISASIEFSDSPVDPEAARQFPQFGSALIFVFAMRMAAMFVMTTSNICRRAGALPKWFVYAGFPTAIFLLLSASFSRALVLVFPIWLMVLCTILFRRSLQIPREQTLPIPSFAEEGSSPYRPLGNHEKPG
jgi:hypothetical protein